MWANLNHFVAWQCSRSYSASSTLLPDLGIYHIGRLNVIWCFTSKFMLNGRTRRELHKVMTDSKIKVCANLSRFRAETDARADVKHLVGRLPNKIAKTFFRTWNQYAIRYAGVLRKTKQCRLTWTWPAWSTTTVWTKSRVSCQLQQLTAAKSIKVTWLLYDREWSRDGHMTHFPPLAFPATNWRGKRQGIGSSFAILLPGFGIRVSSCSRAF